jgi:hypothetical protein
LIDLFKSINFVLTFIFNIINFICDRFQAKPIESVLNLDLDTPLDYKQVLDQDDILFQNDLSGVYYNKYTIRGVHLQEYVKQNGIQNPDLILGLIEKRFLAFKFKYDEIDTIMKSKWRWGIEYRYYENEKQNLFLEVSYFEKTLKFNIDSLCYQYNNKVD